jgi:hypothetical protein
MQKIYDRTKRNCNSELEYVDELLGGVCLAGWMWHKHFDKEDIDEVKNCANLNVVCERGELDDLFSIMQSHNETGVIRVPEEARSNNEAAAYRIAVNQIYTWHKTGDVTQLNKAWRNVLGCWDK